MAEFEYCVIFSAINILTFIAVWQSGILASCGAWLLGPFKSANAAGKVTAGLAESNGSLPPGG